MDNNETKRPKTPDKRLIVVVISLAVAITIYVVTGITSMGYKNHSLLMMRGPLGTYCAEENKIEELSEWDQDVVIGAVHERTEFTLSNERADELKRLIEERPRDPECPLENICEFYDADVRHQSWSE